MGLQDREFWEDHVARQMRINERRPWQRKAMLRGSFFGAAVQPFFATGNGGLSASLGHLIHRLAAEIPEEDQRSIPVYPDEDGIGSLQQGSMRWISLFDWRQLWEDEHQEVPEIPADVLSRERNRLSFILQ